MEGVDPIVFQKVADISQELINCKKNMEMIFNILNHDFKKLSDEDKGAVVCRLLGSLYGKMEKNNFA